MTIKGGGKREFVIACDDCGHEEYGGVETDFRAFWDGKKREGWKARKNDDGEWEHRCYTCSRYRGDR